PLDRAIRETTVPFCTVVVRHQVDLDAVRVAIGVDPDARERPHGRLRVADLVLGLTIGERATGVLARDADDALVALAERGTVVAPRVVAAVPGLGPELVPRAPDVAAPPPVPTVLVE